MELFLDQRNQVGEVILCVMNEVQIGVLLQSSACKMKKFGASYSFISRLRTDASSRMASVLLSRYNRSACL